MTGYIRQDNDCHYYFIPVKDVEKFDKIMEDMEAVSQFSEEWDDINNTVNDKFSQYMIDSPFDIKFKEVA